MKRQTAIPFLLLFFMLSCRKETPQVDAMPAISNPTDYLLMTQTWTAPTSNGLSYILTYNDQNLLADAEEIQWWGGSVSNGDTSYVHFEYTNGLCRKLTQTHNGSTGSVLYEYNGKGLPVKAVFYNSNEYYKTDKYQYDSADRLLRVIDSSWQINFIYEYSYDDQGDPDMEIASNITDSSKTKYEWSSYDDKINYIRAINGLPRGYLLTGDFTGNFASMPHNVLTNNYTTTVFPYSSDVPGTWQTQYQYEYNEQGLPTRIFENTWIITNTYRQYK
jgi:hypothetical protein